MHSRIHLTKYNNHKDTHTRHTHAKRQMSIGDATPGFMYKVSCHSWWNARKEEDVEFQPQSFATKRMALLCTNCECFHRRRRFPRYPRDVITLICFLTGA
jgi:hypothetical protein